MGRDCLWESRYGQWHRGRAHHRPEQPVVRVGKTPHDPACGQDNAISSVTLPTVTVSPCSSQRVGVKVSTTGNPNILDCCGKASIQNLSPMCGPSTGSSWLFIN